MEYAKNAGKRKIRILVAWLSFCLVLVLAAMHVQAGANSYLLPQSSSVYLTDSDIAGFSLQKLNYAKNEIYARHGRCFQSRELTEYFETKSWYRGTISPENFDEDSLNSYEKQNSKFLLAAELAVNPDGYLLDQPGYDVMAVEEDVVTEEGTLTADQVYDALYLYIDENELDMDSVYRNSGWLQLSEQDEENYTFVLRSYTGAYSYYYVNKISGETYATEMDPLTYEMTVPEYMCNLKDYVFTETDFGELTETGTFCGTMRSETRGYPYVLDDGFLGNLYEYEVQDGEFVIHGSLNRCKPDGGMDSSEKGYLPNGKRRFRCDENTQYLSIGGDGPATEFTQEEFLQIIENAKDSGLGFVIKIQNGIASSVTISS